MQATGQPPPDPAKRSAVREWAILLGGTSLGLVLAGTAWLGYALARRRQRLRALQRDTSLKLARERTAWEEAGRRAEAPSIDELEDGAGEGER